MRALQVTLLVSVTGLAPLGGARFGGAPIGARDVSAEEPEHRSRVVSVDRLPQRSILDAGPISVGNSLQLSVLLRSDLGQPLTIRSVSSDCGCLKVEQDTGQSRPRDPQRNESPRNESPRNESPRSESHRNESHRNESHGNESHGNESQGNKSQRNESQRNESQGNESRTDASPAEDSAPSGSPSRQSVVLRVQLAPSHKLGRIRRNIRVVFDQAPTLPLDLGLDTRIHGPIEFESRGASIESPGNTITIAGVKRDDRTTLLECEALRGCCEVLGLEQTDDRFQLRVRPLVAFGSAQELFRLRFRRSESPDWTFVDLPFELRSISPLRFFPSIAPIRFEEGAWRSAAKLVFTPDANIDVDQLVITLEREDQSVIAPDQYRVNLLQSSIVLYSVHVECFAAEEESNRPARLRIADSHEKHLATLHFSNP